MRISVAVLCSLSLAHSVQAQAPDGRVQYESRCSNCHGGDGANILSFALLD